MVLDKKPAKPNLRQFGLRTTLVIPFVLQIVTAVGLVGYFSYRNGRQAVDDLANQLTEEVANRIEEHVDKYFDKPHEALRVLDDGVKSKTINLDDFDQLRSYFWQLVRGNDFESYHSYGNEEGEFVGVEYREDRSYQIKIRTKATEPIRKVYDLNGLGEPNELLKESEYDPRDRPWYQAAKWAGIATWSPIYPFFSRRDSDAALGISAVRPIFDRNEQFLGVLCINLTLIRITNFFQNLEISPNGQSFIIERSGDLVVNSNNRVVSRSVGEGDKAITLRIPALESKDNVLQVTAKTIVERFGSFTAVKEREQLKFQIDGKQYYAQILPVRDGRGIDWLVGVVVPESDFMEQIYANTRNTILLCLAALGIAIALGILTARSICSPVLRITETSKQISGGKLDRRVKESSRIIEMETLARSFNSMAIQLKELFHNLEDKVEERTAELAQANQEITSLNKKLKAENLRMGAELDVARQLQQMVLPKPEELENIEGIEIAGFMEPADEVGGDYYDVLQNEGVITIGIGDVTGHGLESGILMLMTQTAVRTLQEIREDNPVKFLDTLNRTIYRNVQRMNSDKNLTLAILNYTEGKLSISGQHEETIVVREGGKIELIDTMDLGLPIGMDDDIVDFIDRTFVELNPGDGVVVYTDGIPEAFDMDKKQYGMEQFCETISHNWHLSAKEIEQAIIKDVRSHIGKQKVFDDITLVVFKRQEIEENIKPILQIT